MLFLVQPSVLPTECLYSLHRLTLGQRNSRLSVRRFSVCLWWRRGSCRNCMQVLYYALPFASLYILLLMWQGNMFRCLPYELSGFRLMYSPPCYTVLGSIRCYVFWSSGSLTFKKEKTHHSLSQVVKEVAPPPPPPPLFSSLASLFLIIFPWTDRDMWWPHSFLPFMQNIIIHLVLVNTSHRQTSRNILYGAHNSSCFYHISFQFHS